MAPANPRDTSIENYLKSIYHHTEWQAAPVTPSVLAARLGVAPSSVTEMVKKLASAGYTTHVPYGAIELTDAGRRRALDVIRRHRLIETWLVSDMGYTWDEVHDEAEVLEHSISDRLLRAIDDRLGWPSQDPHGDPIPRADGTMPELSAVRLADAPGACGRVVRVDDTDPALLRTLAERGVTPGAHLDSASADLPDGAAAAIWVAPSA